MEYTRERESILNRNLYVEDEKDSEMPKKAIEDPQSVETAGAPWNPWFIRS